jgi:hypothetical protein
MLLKLIISQKEHIMKKDREQARIQRLQNAVTSFINASSWFGAAKVMEAIPELLEEDVPGLVRHVADFLFEKGLDTESRAYEQCAAVLDRCREVGIAQAIREMEGVRKLRFSPQTMITQSPEPTSPALTAFLEADGLDALQVLEEHPELVSQESLDRIEDYIAYFRSLGDEVSVKTLEMRRDLLRRW